MKSFMMIVLAILMIATLLRAQDEDGPGGPPDGPSDGPWGPGGPTDGPGGPPKGPWGPDDPRGPGGKHGPPHSIGFLELFPGCANMAQAMRDKHKDMIRNNQNGLKSCRGSDDFLTCWQRSMEVVRCAVTEKPSDDCMEQINDFMQGSNCVSGTTENSTLDDYDSLIE